MQPDEHVPFAALPLNVEDVTRLRSGNDDTSLGVGSRDAHGWDCPTHIQCPSIARGRCDSRRRRERIIER